MRFFADGPNIPDELLEDRDRGRVVFLCGAGISMPAGLPNFAELARQVMRQLGTPEYADSYRLLHDETFASLDRVFNHLYEEYRRDEVDRVVRSLLRTPPKVATTNHETILRISANTKRQPQVVTTNFDLIFERARSSLEIHVAPALPNIASSGGFSGLVYLHGRLLAGADASRGSDQLILSSSDFGRAYLANGWATNFVRELLQTYVIVLVGYSASDPPIRYLLEGLRADPRRTPGTIYSFDCGTEEDVAARWATLGVRPIAYGPVNHQPLWETLAAWAERADSPEGWRESVVRMASASPRVLQPHQRGQVASLVRTAAGAAQFADASTPPPAEWLCVLDSRVRRAAVSGRSGDPDPLIIYGLDDDPPRLEDGDDAARAADLRIGDLLSLVAGDERTDQYRRLAASTPEANDRLPKRLAALTRWFGRVCGQPSALWWAAGNKLLHRSVVREVEWALQYRPDWFSNEAKRAWALLLQHVNHSDSDRLEFYQLKQLVTKDGWSPESLRAFGRAIEPHITAERAWGHLHTPQSTDEETDSSANPFSFDVAFLSRHGETMPVPTEWLPRVFEKVRAGLQLGSELLAEIRQEYWQTTTFHPSGDGGDHYPNEASEFLRWGRELFDRLAAEQPDIARDELRRWPTEDKYFFDKLRIYAWGHQSLFSANDVANALVGFWQEGFWNEYHRRELLHTLRARWADFGLDERRRIEARIMLGPPSWLNENIDSFEERKLRTACTLLGWLDRHGCELSAESQKVLSTLRETLPQWQTSREERADQSHDVRVGSVAVDTEPGALIDAPIADLVPLALKTKPDAYEEFTRYAPFQGVVERSARKALLALSFHARRHEDYPLRLWKTLLTHWPQTTPRRVLRLAMARISQLPDAAISGCLVYITQWFRKYVDAEGIPEALALRLLDRLLDVVNAGGPDAVRSGIGEITQGGRVIERSRRTVDHAINSATGDLTEVLLTLLERRGLKANAGLPQPIASRIERLLELGGDGADYTICLLTRQLHWLFSLAPKWVETRLGPMFEPAHEYAEPAWNGYLTSDRLGVPRLFILLRPNFLKVFGASRSWRWDHDGPGQLLGGRLVSACFMGRKNRAYVKYADAREALRQLDDRARAHVLWVVSTSFKEDGLSWKTFGKAFIERAWPRERRFQTPGISEAFASLAEQAGEEFPEVVEAVLPYLVPVARLDMIFYRALNDAEDSIAHKFPEPLLTLLDALVMPEPVLVPYELGTVLETMAISMPALRDDARWKRLKQIASRA